MGKKGDSSETNILMPETFLWREKKFTISRITGKAVGVATAHIPECKPQHWPHPPHKREL
jgi:hypothetical protein